MRSTARAAAAAVAGLLPFASGLLHSHADILREQIDGVTGD
jgi:hypothetical protein